MLSRGLAWAACLIPFETTYVAFVVGRDSSSTDKMIDVCLSHGRITRGIMRKKGSLCFPFLFFGVVFHGFSPLAPTSCHVVHTQKKNKKRKKEYFYNTPILQCEAGQSSEQSTSTHPSAGREGGIPFPSFLPPSFHSFISSPLPSFPYFLLIFLTLRDLGQDERERERSYARYIKE